MVYNEKEYTRSESKLFDISVYHTKYIVPVLEKKWVGFFFFLVCLLLSMGIAVLVKPQFITTATMVVKEPYSTIPTRDRWESGDVVPESAKRAYLYNEIQKLKKGYFAFDVLKASPDEVKEELRVKVNFFYQIIDGIRKVWSSNQVWRDKKPPNKELGSKSDSLNEKELLKELQGRLDVRSDYGTSVVKVDVTTFKKNIGPLFLNTYLNVWITKNLEENRKEAKAVAEFAFKQKNNAYKEFEEAEQKMIEFRRRYQMPAELQVARDVELQLEMDRVSSALQLAKSRYQLLDQMHLETRMKEAGIVGNITVIGPPVTSSAPKRVAGKNIVIIGMIIGLIGGIGLVLLLDFIKGPIRHECDIIESSHLPVLGHIPNV